MKTEFVALGPIGVMGLLLSGVFLGLAIGEQDLHAAALGIMTAVIVRSDAREGFASGCYQRRWFFWCRKGPVA